MKIHENKNGWSIELEDGTTVTMSISEVGILASRYREETLWEEIAMRYDKDPAWHDIVEAKDDIIGDLLDRMELEGCWLADMIDIAIERWVDLDGVDEEEQA